jgi:hypothetical protein
MGGDLGIIDVLGLIVPLYFAYKKKGSRGFWLLLACAAVGVIVVGAAASILTVPHYTFDDWKRASWWQLFATLAAGSYLAAEWRSSDKRTSTDKNRLPDAKASPGIVSEGTRLNNCPVCKNNRYVERDQWGLVCSSPTHERLQFKADVWADPDSQAAIEALEKARKQWE